MPINDKLLGNEIFERINAHRTRQTELALSITRKLARREEVSDGELLDALHVYTANLDMANPMLPVMNELFKRFMDKCDMAETPEGIRREWCDEEDEPEPQPAGA